MSNGYQHLNTNIPQNSTSNNIQSTLGSVGVQRQLPHMIPTPGFSNQQNVPSNPDYSNGTGYFNGESAVAPHMQHQKQFPSNQNSNQIQNIGGHNNSGMHSSMLDNSSAYGLSDGHMNGGIGVHGSNMQLTNRTTAPEAYNHPVRWLVLVLVWAGWCWFFVRGKHCWLAGLGWLIVSFDRISCLIGCGLP